MHRCQCLTSVCQGYAAAYETVQRMRDAQGGRRHGDGGHGGLKEKEGIMPTYK